MGRITKNDRSLKPCDNLHCETISNVLSNSIPSNTAQIKRLLNCLPVRVAVKLSTRTTQVNERSLTTNYNQKERRSGLLEIIESLTSTHGRYISPTNDLINCNSNVFKTPAKTDYREALFQWAFCLNAENNAKAVITIAIRLYDTTTIRRCHDAFDYDGSDRNYDLRSIRLRYDYDTTTTKN